MFLWYSNADKCYVYLADVPSDGDDHGDGDLSDYEDHDGSDLSDGDDHGDGHAFRNPLWEVAFLQSRWFSRGWTLQELLAPASVEFFSSDGDRLGDKEDLEEKINRVTGIPIEALQGIPLSQFTIEERSEWAKNRNTKREEDKVYCLLGIFDANL
jgi:hypothetical protein